MRARGGRDCAAAGGVVQIEPAVMLATPSYSGTVPIPFVRSLLDTVEALSGVGVPHLFVDVSGCAYVERARDMLASAFLDRTACSHLLFVDADMRWPGAAVVRLLNARRPVVAGAYQGRKPPHTWHVERLDGETTDRHGFVAVRRVATGFMLIERAVLEQLAKDAEVYVEDVAGSPLTVRRLFRTGVSSRAWITEDYAFCDAVRAAGFSVYVDTQTTLGHLGERWVTGDVARMASAILEEGTR